MNSVFGARKDEGSRRNYYDIHELLAVVSNVDMDLPNLFRKNGMAVGEIPKILVQVDHDITYATTDTSRAGLQAHYDEYDDTLFFEHPLSFSLLPVKLAVGHLVQPITYIHATMSYYKFVRLFEPGYDLRKIVRLIMVLKLLQNNHVLIHAGCVDLDGKGILIAAFADTGKTRSILSMCTGRNFRYLSDDLTLTDYDGTCFSFPSACTITSGTLRHTHLSLRTRALIKLKFLEAVYKMHPSRVARIKVPVEALLPPDKVIPKTKADTIVFLEKGPHRVREINKDEAASKLLAINQREIPWCTDPITRYYAYFNDEFDVEDLMETERDIIERTVDKTDGCYILRSRTDHYIDIERILERD